MNGDLALSGTLNFTNGPGFGANSYTLFTYPGALTAIDPVIGEHPPGYTATLSTATPGQVNLIAQRAPPEFTTIEWSGSNIVLHGVNGLPGTPFVVLASTNVAKPLTAWTWLATNQFSADGSFAFTNFPGDDQRYFRLLLP